MAVWSLDCTVFFGLISSQKETNIWYNYINIGNKKLLCKEVSMLVLSYKKLFKKLIDIDMQHNELMNKANVSRSTFYKLKNGENVNTQTLLRICNALKCDISEIVECVEE